MDFSKTHTRRTYYFSSLVGGLPSVPLLDMYMYTEATDFCRDCGSGDESVFAALAAVMVFPLPKGTTK